MSNSTEEIQNNKKQGFLIMAPSSMRIWFAIMGTLLWTGLYLSGFSNMHWLLYVPTVGFTFAAITGICPSQIGVFKTLGVKIDQTSC